MEIRAGGLIGNRESCNGIVQHKGMNILFGLIVINDTGAGDIRAVAARSADPQTGRHFNADLGGRVRNDERQRNICIPHHRIHIPLGAAHGEGAADSHFGSGVSFFQLVLDTRAAERNGTEEIRSGKGNDSRRNSFRYALYRYVIKYGICPAAQEGQGCAAFDANGSACAFFRTGIRSRSAFFRSGRRSRSAFARSRITGFTPRGRCAGRVALILGFYIVLFQVFRVRSGRVCSLCTLFRPFCPFLGILIILLLRRSGGVSLGIILDHARGNSCSHKTACGDGTLCSAGRTCAQFPDEGTSCNIPRQLRIFIDLLGGFFRIRGIFGIHHGGRIKPTAIVSNHGNAVYIIVYNTHANTECFGAFASLRFGAGRVINVGGVRRGDSSEPGCDSCLIVNGNDAVAVAVAEGDHAGNANRIPLACLLDLVLHLQPVVGRNFQRLSPREFYALSGDDQTIAADILNTHRGADAHLGVRPRGVRIIGRQFFGSVKAHRAGCGVG